MATIKAGEYIFKETLSFPVYSIGIQIPFKLTNSQIPATYNTINVRPSKWVSYTKPDGGEDLVYSNEQWKENVVGSYRYITFTADTEVSEDAYNWLRDNQYDGSQGGDTPEDGGKIYNATSISGKGDETSRKNEITANDTASFLNFVVGHESGVVSDETHGIKATITSPNTVSISNGMIFAYGYFGMAFKYEQQCEMSFMLPPVEQYYLVYAEINLSVIPNTCTIKVKNNQSSNRVLKNTFRQDELSEIKTGVYQIPLWRVYITNKGIQRIDSIQNLCTHIETVVHADNILYGIRPNGKIGKYCTCPTPSGANIKQIVDDIYVRNEVEKEIKK